MTQVLVNLIDHGLTLQEAINAPRIHRHTKTGELLLEARITSKVRNALARKGYPIVLKKDFDLYLGGAQGVMINKPPRFPGAAPRREGTVMALKNIRP
jgi:gamma-glutamyltranspeptidase/glutathione hydrolase